MSRPKRQALGRGLGALLPGPPQTGSSAAPAPMPEVAAPAKGARTVPIEQLTPNPDQPRRHFDPARLDELAQSIAAQGIIQPIVVAPEPAASGAQRRYLIIAGERRWRAAQRAGLHGVPVVVRDVEKDDRLEVALIENIQRADLNPIDEARAFAELCRLRGYTQEELAKRVGKDRSTIANAVRLLRLPPKVQTLVVEGQLTMGHARALLGLPAEDDMTELAAQIVRSNLSVRATEAAVRKQSAAPHPPPGDELERRRIIVAELETRLRRRLGAQVRLKASTKNERGTIEIPYGSLDELDRLLQVILG